MLNKQISQRGAPRVHHGSSGMVSLPNSKERSFRDVLVGTHRRKMEPIKTYAIDPYGRRHEITPLLVLVNGDEDKVADEQTFQLVTKKRFKHRVPHEARIKIRGREPVRVNLQGGRQSKQEARSARTTDKETASPVLKLANRHSDKVPILGLSTSAWRTKNLNWNRSQVRSPNAPINTQATRNTNESLVPSNGPVSTSVVGPVNIEVRPMITVHEGKHASKPHRTTRVKGRPRVSGTKTPVVNRVVHCLLPARDLGNLAIPSKIGRKDDSHCLHHSRFHKIKAKGLRKSSDNTSSCQTSSNLSNSIACTLSLEDTMTLQDRKRLAWKRRIALNKQQRKARRKEVVARLTTMKKELWRLIDNHIITLDERLAKPFQRTRTRTRHKKGSVYPLFLDGNNETNASQARFDALVNRAITSLNDQQRNKRINPTSNPKRPSIIQIARQARQLLNKTEPGGYQFRKHGNLHERVSSYLERSGFHHGQEGNESYRKLSERRLNRSYRKFMNDWRPTRRHIVKRQRGPTPIINICNSEDVDTVAKDDYYTIHAWSHAPARKAHVNMTHTVHVSPHSPSVVVPRDSAPVLHDTTPHADADRQPTTPNDHNEDHGVNDIALVSLPPVSNDPGDDGDDTSIAPSANRAEIRPTSGEWRTNNSDTPADDISAIHRVEEVLSSDALLEALRREILSTTNTVYHAVTGSPPASSITQDLTSRSLQRLLRRAQADFDLANANPNQTNEPVSPTPNPTTRDDPSDSSSDEDASRNSVHPNGDDDLLPSNISSSDDDSSHDHDPSDSDDTPPLPSPRTPLPFHRMTAIPATEFKRRPPHKPSSGKPRSADRIFGEMTKNAERMKLPVLTNHPEPKRRRGAFIHFISKLRSVLNITKETSKMLRNTVDWRPPKSSQANNALFWLLDAYVDRHLSSSLSELHEEMGTYDGLASLRLLQGICAAQDEDERHDSQQRFQSMLIEEGESIQHFNSCFNYLVTLVLTSGKKISLNRKLRQYFRALQAHPSSHILIEVESWKHAFQRGEHISLSQLQLSLQRKEELLFPQITKIVHRRTEPTPRDTRGSDNRTNRRAPRTPRANAAKRFPNNNRSSTNSKQSPRKDIKCYSCGASHSLKDCPTTTDADKKRIYNEKRAEYENRKPTSTANNVRQVAFLNMAHTRTDG